MSSQRTIVLGGGGVTGIAWEVGILLGLQRAGIAVRGVDSVIGTSAGSVVGTFLASGVDLETIAAEQLAAPADEPPIHADMTMVMSTLMLLFDPSKNPIEARQAVGKIALATANLDDEAAYLRRFARYLANVNMWPTKPRLRITGVDAVSGESIIWDAASNVSLNAAIAASCAVPCIFPPVTIDGKRYMDGGIRSAINADLAAGAQQILVIAPMLAFSPRWPNERAKLGDAQVVAVAPDAAATEASGQNFMDVSRRAPSFNAGLAQAATLVDSVRALFV